ncbi:MAG: ComEC/Rec2 family competence protein [Oscillospiraceae bacterium]|nr:ComEC/Rec2 family competence protein [Oscillospiraceae bacterium]
MIFSERRLAAAFAVFLLFVFLVCVFQYKFAVAAAVISLFLSAGFAVSRLAFAKSKKDGFKRFLSGAAVCFLSAALAALYCLLRYNAEEKPVLDYLQKYEETPVFIKAEIKGVSSTVFMSVFDLSVYEVDGERTNKFNLSLSVYGEIEAGDEEIGDTLETYVVFKTIEEAATSDSNLAYFKSNGYYIAAEHSDYEGDGEGEGDFNFNITPADSRGADYYLQSMRNHAKNTFFANIKFDYHDKKTDEASVVFGIFTGDKSHIDPSVKTDFKKAGISHVLSVSGLHLSILCWAIFSFLNFLKVHKKISCAAIILCCLIFMAFTGFSVSLIRAGAMTVLFYLAFLAGRKSDPLTSLFFAGTFVILLNPYNILNIGFQLSFFATLGILSSSELIGKINSKIDKFTGFKFIKRILKILVSSFGISLAAIFFTLPFTAYNFKTLSLVSPLTNLLTAPIVTLVLILALCLLIFSFIPVVPVVFGLPLFYITKILLKLTKYLASFKYSYISVESTNKTGFYIFALVFLFCVILFFAMPKIHAKKFLKPIFGAVLVVSFAAMAASLIYPRIAFAQSVRAAYYSDDKNQNIILFQGDYDSADIVDFTHGTRSHVKPVYDIMLENGAVRINSVILTDYRKRHVQMLKKYMEYSEIKTVYIPKPSDAYDAEVQNMLYYMSIGEDGRQNFELVRYEDYLVADKVLLNVMNFDYDKMRHTATDIYYRIAGAERRLLYLGIGYMEGYGSRTKIGGERYDVVFYGTHKHNRRDDDYVSDVYGLFAGVLSSYFDENKNETTQKLGAAAVEAYRSGSELFKSENCGPIVFEVQKDGSLKYYLK